ncbi:hypothetical protein HII31_06026 [Pseudocercospora fuligena]|uniref:DUF3500 domain-containing protein n=1 Tax=Pseudocercospora fuligena TaxID=685502 RepID=A0A8H6VMY7_9PEZI|nr:hypothetical protein HII31_06026 [Pseudocercospora fuligena]
MAATTAAQDPSPFRKFIKSESPFLKDIGQHTAVSHADDAVIRLPQINKLIANWQQASKEPLKGVTRDGNIRPNLFQLADDELDVEAIVDAAEHLLSTLTSEQKAKTLLDFDAPEKRMWQNTHLYVPMSRFGIRLDEVKPEVLTQALELLKATLSPEGYEKAIIATETNHFLGTLYNGHGILNRFSYNLAIFGTPSTTEPWAYTFFGHHLCLSIFLRGKHIEITPTFMGAEPNMIDEGPLAGTQLYIPEQELALKFMRGLSPELRKTAQASTTLDRAPGHQGAPWRAVCGAFQDNAVIQPEGLQLGLALMKGQRDLILQIIEQFVIYLPEKARSRRVRQAEKDMFETYFTWAGGFGEEDPFYYRIHGPTIIVEFEHCPSIFLGNTKAERFHIHTHVRTPNGGDYGHALV